MYIKIPPLKLSESKKLYITPKIKIDDSDNNNNRVICVQNIKKDEVIIKEYPTINLFGEYVNDRDIEFVKKLIYQSEDKLFPRTYSQLNSTKMTKEIYKKANKYIKNNKIYDQIEFYYAKHLFNSFEGFEYGPLYLPIIAKLNHSCNPNTYFELDKSTGQMILYAKRNITKGEELFDSYLMNKKIDNHKYYLREHYNFCCEC